MVKEKVLIVIFIICIIASLTISTIYNIVKNNELSYLTTIPFDDFFFLKEEIELSKTKKVYYLKTDCSSIEENQQLISYKLKEEYSEAKIKVNSFFQNEKENLILNVIVQIPSEKEYEQLYQLNITCSK